MTEIKIIDYRTLEPIEEFTQYDSNRIILIPKVGSVDNVVCHFCNAQSKEAYVMEVTEYTLNDNTYYKTIVPNILLLENSPIYVYLYVTIEDEKKVTFYSKVSVRKKLAPNEFVYENNSKYYDIVEMNSKIENLIQDVENLKSNSSTGGTADITDGSITSAKLANASVTTTKLASYAVTAAKIANNSISSLKIINGTVTKEKLSDDAIAKIKVFDNEDNEIINEISDTKTLEELGIAPFRLLDLSQTSESQPLIIIGNIIPASYVVSSSGYIRLNESAELIYLIKGSIIIYDFENPTYPGISICCQAGSYYYDQNGVGGYCITNNELEVLTSKYEERFEVKSFASALPIAIPYMNNNCYWIKKSNTVNTIKINFNSLSNIDETMFKYRITMSTGSSPTLTITNNSAYNIIHTGTDCSEGIWTPQSDMRYTINYFCDGENIIGEVIGFLLSVTGISSTATTTEE